MRGWTILAFERHVSDLFEMEPEELCGFWSEVANVAQVLDRLYRPVKIDYAVST